MRPALPHWLRATTVITHITAAGTWIGGDIILIALAIAHAPVPDLFGPWVTTPAAATTLATGITLGACRPWGLRSHHWLIVKLQLATIITAAGLTSLAGILDPATALTARICALIALIAAVAVSVTKPWGLTEHGRTKNRTRRLAPSPEPADVA